MTDKEYEAQKKRIRYLTAKWVKTLGLGWWRIDIAYDRNPPAREGYEYSPSDSQNWDVAMTCVSDPNYCKALITFYCSVTKGLSDSDLEEAFLHELMHIMVSPMRSKQKAGEEERVATLLARGILWYEAAMLKKMKVLQAKLDKLSVKV